MRRREFISLVGGAAATWTAAWTLAAHAQQKTYLIGFMGNSTAALEANLLNAFREGLREAGYEEGRNITIKYLWADGQYDRFSTLVSELVAAKVDVIVTAGTPAALAVKQNPTNIPLVMVAVGDPVGTGLVENLAHPGGKLTGLSSIAPDLEGKRLQLLREVVPGLSHVVMLINSLNPFHIASVRQALAAAQTLGIRLQQLDVHKSDDIDGVLAALRKDRPDGLFILADRVFLHNRQRIADFAVEQRLPSINAYEELVEAGGLMSYGPSYEDMHRRAATYVDKILKGAKPGNLPIEQPTKFTLHHQSRDGEDTRRDNTVTIARSCRSFDRMRRREFVAGLILAPLPHSIAVFMTQRVPANASRACGPRRRIEMYAEHWRMIECMVFFNC